MSFSNVTRLKLINPVRVKYLALIWNQHLSSVKVAPPQNHLALYRNYIAAKLEPDNFLANHLFNCDLSLSRKKSYICHFRHHLTLLLLNVTVIPWLSRPPPLPSMLLDEQLRCFSSPIVTQSSTPCLLDPQTQHLPTHATKFSHQSASRSISKPPRQKNSWLSASSGYSFEVSGLVMSPIYRINVPFI